MEDNYRNDSTPDKVREKSNKVLPSEVDKCDVKRELLIEKKLSFNWITKEINLIEIHKLRASKFGNAEFLELLNSIFDCMKGLLDKVKNANNVRVINKIDEKVDNVVSYCSKLMKEFRMKYMKQPKKYEELFLEVEPGLTLEDLLSLT